MKKILRIGIAVALLALPRPALASEDIGAIVALRGSAVIQREAKSLEAKLRDGIRLMDTIETREKTRAKMLFVDDSVLTLGENSKAVIKEFVYAKDKKGRSIFNLIDGKMRSVVGKAGFEVHTPTAVAAARGTVIDFVTGMLAGVYFTTIECLEGEVDIRSTDPSISGKVVLTPGMTITVTSSQPLPSPKPVTSPKTGISAPAEAGLSAEPSAAAHKPLHEAPPVRLQPPVTKTTPVAVEVRIP